MSDRVAVFNKGRIEQMDSPRNLYNRPSTAFVAEFVGTANVIGGALSERLSRAGKSFALRPEYVSVNGADTSGDIRMGGTVRDVQYQGANTRYEIELEGGAVINASEANAFHGNDSGPRAGQQVSVSWHSDAMVELQGGASL